MWARHGIRGTSNGRPARRCSTWNDVFAVGSGPLVITAPGKANLNFTGTRPIASLTLNGTSMPPGTCGSTASNATNKIDTCFSGTGTVTVLQPTTTLLNLTTGSSPAASGSSLTFTATVTGSSPSGNVQLFSRNTLLGTSALNGSFQATFTTNQLAIGPPRHHRPLRRKQQQRIQKLRCHRDPYLARRAHRPQCHARRCEYLQYQPLLDH